MDNSQIIISLKRAAERGGTVDLSVQELQRLSVEDIPENVEITVVLDERNFAVVSLIKQDRLICAEIEFLVSDSFWYHPLGWREYIDLVKRYLELDFCKTGRGRGLPAVVG